MENKIKNLRRELIQKISGLTNEQEINNFKIKIYGKNSPYTAIFTELKNLDPVLRPKIGQIINELKNDIEKALEQKKRALITDSLQKTYDVTLPGNTPRTGHLHIISQAIEEITEIFARIGFNRVRYPEVEWEWYSFESLNMPLNHPARDDFETFFIDEPPSLNLGKMVLSPHTSSGQVREMERANHQPPIRMINIAKCYRPNWDINHTPMFHQFEGLVVDENINISHLKGTMDHFAREFFGTGRKTRLRPFHFQFTEPSFEVDINCGLCLGSGKLPDGKKCRYCKSGWLELGGSGMVHPAVLRAGKIDPQKYTGFAFGWGVERTFMMKSDLKLDDNRMLYTNDIRFLEQF